jgi:phosphoglycerate dehydrogenase-like enzyme
MTKIAIVNSSSFGNVFKQHLTKLKSAGQVTRFTFPIDIPGKQLAAKLKGFPYIIASVTPNFSTEFFDNCPGVKLLSRHGIGYNNVDIVSATRHGVLVTKVTGIVEQEAMAEHAITLLLTVSRHIIPAYDAVTKNLWKTRASFIGIELKHKQVGVIGFGNIGSRVAEILKKGFNADILVYDPNMPQAKIDKLGYKPVSLDKLLLNSDIITLHASVNKTNHHLLKEQQFKKIKQGVIIVNTARGELLDDKILIKYLKTGKIAGYGADVVEGEPITGNHPLLKFKNVIIVPHIGAYTQESLKQMGDKVVDDVIRLINDRIPTDIVNPEVLKY